MELLLRTDGLPRYHVTLRTNFSLMAQGTKGAVGQPASTSMAPSSNGLLAANNPPGLNRKKQKRRQKQAAKAAAEQDDALRHAAATNPHASNGRIPHSHSGEPPAEDPYAAQEQYDEDPYYTDEDGQAYDGYDPTLPNGHYAGGQPDADSTDKSKKKKKKNKSGGQERDLDQSSSTYPPSTSHSHLQSMSKSALHSVKYAHDRDRIWNTSTQEERERIKEFWLDLGEEERKSLVKIEKEAVLRKMKEQQKHSCSCTVCGRKRTAIEEELEVLYDAYYDELEQFGTLQHGAVYAAGMKELRLKDRDKPPALQPPLHGQIEDVLDEDEDEEEDDEDELYSDEDVEFDAYSDEEADRLGRQADFFNFGNSLTVKGGILTVADDLLKNDGKKFIEMMEQLAERRMAREEEAQYASASHPSSYHGGYPHNHPPEDDDYEDEDEEDYDSQEEYDEEEDDMVSFCRCPLPQLRMAGYRTLCKSPFPRRKMRLAYPQLVLSLIKRVLKDTADKADQNVMTEEQRMEEGRRMFQIFAARMFEQRVLTAYREKVARERQQKLLEELEEEKSHDVQREAKKARDAQKKKEKKALQKQKQAEEKARKDAEKAAQVAAEKAAKERQDEEKRKKKEEQMKKKEAERKSQEEEKQRKDAEKLKRLQEERERQQEAERKAREQRKAREDAQRKQREEREAKEREAKERKAQADKEKARAEKDAQERARKDAAHAAHQAAQAPKRSGAPTAVPIPPGLSKQLSNVSSPHVPVATPALPKAPTPVRVRQGSQQGSKGSSPKTPSVVASQTKSTSPAGSIASAQQPLIAPKTILQKPPAQTQPAPSQQVPPASPMHSMPPPPGMPMPMPQAPGFGLPPGLNGFPPISGLMQRGPGGQGSQAFSQQTTGGQFPSFGAPNAVVPPPGISGPNMPFGRGFPDVSGLPHQFSGMGGVTQAGPFSQIGRDSVPATSGPGAHSRQTSFEQKAFESAANVPSTQPIARPVAPPKRASSAKPGEPSQDDKDPGVDDITKHLGSSALLDDSDEPVPLNPAETQRPAGAPGLMRGSSNLSNVSNMSAFGSPMFSNPPGQPRMESFGGNPMGTWNNTPPLSFGPTSAASWGNSPMSGWTSATSSMGGFGMGMGTSGSRRPVQTRIQICNAFRQLMAAKATNAEGFVDASTVLRQLSETVHPPVLLEELLEFCDTEGNATNGGGNFQIIKHPEHAHQTLIKYEPDPVSAPATRNVGAGDIGSPSVGSSVPGGSGGPFGSMRGFPFGQVSGQ